MEDYERTLASINEVFVFKIPPQRSASGHRAADWPKEHAWEGRLQIVAQGDDCAIKLIDKNGQLFAKAPQKKNGPSPVEPVSDSSRYFCLRIQDEKSGKHAFIGIAFNQRSDAFDFNVALADHKKQIEREEEDAAPSGPAAPSKDYSLKEGQTIRVAIKGKKSGGNKKKTGQVQSAGFGLLAPPPPAGASRGRNKGGAGGIRLAQQKAKQKTQAAPASAPAPAPATADLLGGFGAPSPAPAPAASGLGDFTQMSSALPTGDPFGSSDPFAPAPAPAPQSLDPFGSSDPFAPAPAPAPQNLDPFA